MAYDNELKGVLFRNEKRESEKHPNYKGSITIQGVEYWLSAWINEKKDGSGKYMSLKAQPKEERNQSKPAQNDPFAGQASPDSFGGGQAQDDSIPF